MKSYSGAYIMEQLRVGIAGYGIVGQRRRGCVDRHPKMQIVGVCDRTFTGNGTFDDGVNYFSNYADLLNEDLDALLVCLTNDVASDVCIAGLEKGAINMINVAIAIGTAGIIVGAVASTGLSNNLIVIVPKMNYYMFLILFLHLSFLNMNLYYLYYRQLIRQY